MKNKSHLLIGAHVSISGGFFKAIEEGMETGCTAIQIFTKSNRQWTSKPIVNTDAQLFIETQKKSAIKIVIAHASYLINLGSATPNVQKKSFIALVDEITRCHQLQIPYLVLHPGTAELHLKEETLKQTGNYINQALQETSLFKVTVLLETMAGQGKSIGSSFEELAAMLDQIMDKKRIGICFDTCHAFAAGYNLTTPEGFSETFKEFDRIIGLDYLKIFHINDSKKEIGSHVDRHENIGEGAIKLAAFSMIMNDPRFQNIPKILETPVITTAVEDHKKNLKILLRLVQ